MLMMVGSSAVAFVLARRCTVWLVVPLNLVAIIAILAVDIRFQRSALTQLLDASIVGVFIDFGYLGGLVFYSIFHIEGKQPESSADVRGVPGVSKGSKLTLV
jgi:hypothetical protein